MTVETQYYPFAGGVNEVDPPISIPVGFLRTALNYEGGVRGGYRRMDGYERYDGRDSPSDATYWIMTFDAGSTAISAGDLIGDSASPTIQGEALIDAVVESGTWGGADAAGYVPVMAVSGKTSPASFSDDDSMYVGASVVATVNGAMAQRGASTDALDATYYADAVSTTRAKIAAVPGSGPVRGVYTYGGVQYAFRNNAGGTAGVMHKASTAGWTAVDLGASLDFTSGGTTEIVVGDTVDGATSGASGVVAGIRVDSGTWAGGDAAGTMYLHTLSGTFQAENLDVGAATNLATASGAQTAQTLPAGGRYEFDTANFFGHSSSIKMYGANGVGTAFQFDGTGFVPIITGMDTDTPTYVKEHKKHLFLAFSGGSLQNSPIGDPIGPWSVVTGASEIGTADEISGLVSLPGDVLGVLNRNRTYVLYGSSTSDFSLDEHSDTTGAIPRTIQRIGNAVYLDDRGLTSFVSVDTYGNFEDATISQLVRETIAEKKILAIGSIISRDKNQYRLFFSDKTGLTVTFDNRQVSAIMPFQLDHVIQCTSSEEDSFGREVMFFGSDDGFVYQLDKGVSFDGEMIEAYVAPVFNNVGSPDVLKHFYKLSLEMTIEGDTSLTYLPMFSYDDGDSAPASDEAVSILGGGGFWDASLWDDFLWSSPPEARAEARIDGSGDNFGLVIHSEVDDEMPHTIFGAVVHYEARRRRR